ncbi:MAG TPA: MEDS domain-containing protein [Nitrososphaera sp.]|nr:MEDS domain-containing protein [Nitrososphaera sp.]
MEWMIQDNNHHHPNCPIDSNKIVHGNCTELPRMMAETKMLEPGSHNLVIYKDLKTFREIYSQCSRALLPKDEIVVIGTQYDSPDKVKDTLRLVGVDVERHLNKGTLFIVDAQQGYQGCDPRGIWKLAMSLLSRTKKEGRRGVTWVGDAGSFFSFEKIEELMQYELSLPQKYEDTIKTMCSYHLKDFETLTEGQQHTLIHHHFKSILVE